MGLLQGALEANGLTFLDGNYSGSGGPGVRLNGPTSRSIDVDIHQVVQYEEYLVNDAPPGAGGERNWLRDLLSPEDTFCFFSNPYLHTSSRAKSRQGQVTSPAALDHYFSMIFASTIGGSNLFQGGYKLLKLHQNYTELGVFERNNFH